MKRLLLIASLMLCACAADAKLQLKSFFSDGMVLQQSADAAIWGTAAPGATITIKTSWNKAAVKVSADSEGSWNATVRTCKAGYAPQEITIKCGRESITIKDVLIGEVWFASGQSNMEMPIRGFFNCPVADAAEVISQAPATDRIRMFTVKKGQSYEPLSDVEGTWCGAEPATVAEMSATAYFFARKMNATLDVPVGILLCAYGGARVESWMPKSILETYPTEDLSREHIEAMTGWSRPYLAYNAMLVPMVGYTIKGFIWYQGCSNVGAHQDFVDHMSAMVAHWRGLWGDTQAALPFYQVEIAPCTDYSPDGEVSYPALLRQAQHDAARAIPNSAIVVTNDLVAPYEAWNIHPCRKQPVGDRLACLALHRDYGFEGIPCYSPEALSARMLPDGKIGIELTEVEWNGISRFREVEALEVKDAEGVWHEVKTISFGWQSKLLTIDTKGIEGACEVRYGWGAFRPGNIKSGLGLPLSPFDLVIK